MPAVKQIQSTRREVAIAALLTQPTVTLAAKSTGINERTLRRWLTLDPDFVEAYVAARRRALDGAIALLQAGTADAVAALHRNLSPDRPPAIQVRAATAWISLVLRGTELLDVSAKIDAIDERLQEQKDRYR